VKGCYKIDKPLLIILLRLFNKTFQYPITNKELPISKYWRAACGTQNVEFKYLDIDYWKFCGWILRRLLLRG